ncbi:MAG: YidC/Oxa1 family membrane protein insertase [Firmicutes bacterium]|nr:YidC/Oxa1 family membrane protein insertase [Bacillota bacterium]
MQMKNKKVLVIVLFVMIIFLPGCTKLLKNSENQNVQNTTTGQSLVENILCQPEDETTLELYKQNNIDVSTLPKCDEFKITSGGYEGIWTTIFVKPLAWIIIQIGKLVKNYGLAVIIVTLLIRLIMYPMTQKTAMQSENIKNAKPELDKLEKKYQNRQDNEAMMQKSQEMMIIYKKYNISPLSGCLFSLIQIPLFFAFYEAMNRLPALFEENLLGFQLGTSPLTGMSNGNFGYIIFVILVIGATYFSFKLNSTAGMGNEQEKQMKMMTNISVIMISIASFTISSGIALYWIFNSGFTILQNLLVKRRKLNDNVI